MPKLMIGTPYTRPFEGEYVHSLFLTKNEGDIRWLRVPGRAVDEARNIIVDKFKETDCDFLLMADSDATWHPEAAHRLVQRNLPVVCGGMFSRVLPPYPTIGRFYGVENERQLYQFGPTIGAIARRAKIEKVFDKGLTRNTVLFPKRDEDIMEIDGCGMHFTLIRRDVLDALSHPYFVLDMARMGEDFYFCQQVQKAGFKLYFDTSVYTGHILGEGSELGLNEFLAFMRLSDNIEEFMDGFLDVGGWRA